ncbi:MAG TPA: hypothetical protein EYP23_02845 [Thermoplasmata archaeon]|nr:hypothetical protein [Thermoplasmata archaeon]
MKNGLVIAVGLIVFFFGFALLLSFVYIPDQFISFLQITGVVGWLFVLVGLVVTYIGVFRCEVTQLMREEKQMVRRVEAFYSEQPVVERKVEPFVYQGYTLYKRMVKLLSGKWQTIYFFSKRLPKSGEPTPMPQGYRVGVNKRSGMPFLIKIKSI